MYGLGSEACGLLGSEQSVQVKERPRGIWVGVGLGGASLSQCQGGAPCPPAVIVIYFRPFRFLWIVLNNLLVIVADRK